MNNRRKIKQWERDVRKQEEQRKKLKSWEWGKQWKDYCGCRIKSEEFRITIDYNNKSTDKKVLSKLEKMNKERADMLSHISIWNSLYGEEFLEKLFVLYHPKKRKLPPDPKTMTEEQKRHLMGQDLEDEEILVLELEEEEETEDATTVEEEEEDEEVIVEGGEEDEGDEETDDEIEPGGGFDLHINDLAAPNNNSELEIDEEPENGDSGGAESLPEETAKRSSIKAIEIWEEPGTDLIEEYEEEDGEVPANPENDLDDMKPETKEQWPRLTTWLEKALAEHEAANK